MTTYSTREPDPVPGSRLSGKELDTIKTTLGVSDTWLAEALHVSRNTIYRWRSGREVIPYRVPAKLALALHDLARRAIAAAESLPQTL